MRHRSQPSFVHYRGREAVHLLAIWTRTSSDVLASACKSSLSERLGKVPLIRRRHEVRLETRTPRSEMNPRPCTHCGAPTIHPPSTLDLLAPMCCERCGANHGSWRSVENRPDATDLPSRPSSD